MNRPIPDYVASVLSEADQMDFPVALPKGVRPSRYNPILVTVVRDEMGQLPDFLDHHRARGIREFLVLDNGSTDGSLAFLEAQRDVSVSVIDRPFSWKAKHGWITHVVRRLGTERWYLVLDADERIVFCGEQRHDLGDLAAQMELQGNWRVRGVLVDLYPPGPVLKAGDAHHDRFDAKGYRREITNHLQSVKGGPRSRALSSEAFPLDPELTKYPLFRIAPDDVVANPHHIWPYEENYKSPCYLGLLHHKFSAGLLGKIRQAVEEKNYWNDSFEYRAYNEILAANPGLSLEYEGTRRYDAPEDLLDSGLIQAVDWRYEAFRRRWRRLRDRWWARPD